MVLTLRFSAARSSISLTTKVSDTLTIYKAQSTEGATPQKSRQIQAYKKWKKNDEIVRYIMSSAMQNDLISQFEVNETAKDMWETLHKEFETARVDIAI